jgi:2-isopropylmalate synthase
LIHFHADGTSSFFQCRASVQKDGKPVALTGEGNGPIAAFVDALQKAGVPPFSVAYYKEHALSSGSDSSAIAYIQIRLGDGTVKWGAGENTNIELASIQAILSALNRV